jgi:hypothetical protein
MGPAFGLEEQGVFAMEDRFLKGAFGDVMPTSGLCRVGGLGVRVSGFG